MDHGKNIVLWRRRRYGEACGIRLAIGPGGSTTAPDEEKVND
jgi:hypothetical protein